MIAKQRYRAAVSIIGLTFIGVEGFLSVSKADEGQVFETIMNFFSFFTIQSNLLVVVVMGISALNVNSFASSAPWRAAITLYITLVALVYHTVLAPIHFPVGLAVWSNFSLHTFIPLAVIFDWFIFSDKSTLKISHSLKWLIFPMIYCAYTLTRGSVVDWYPYPFLDHNSISYSEISINVIVLIAMFYVSGMLLVGYAKLSKARARQLSA